MNLHLNQWFTIRPEHPADVSLISVINDLAFKGPNESKLVQGIRSSEFFVPDLSLVAVKGSGEIIGHILFSIVSIETQNGVVPTLALAPMAVHPDHQNQGVGSSLVREGLQRCQQVGFQHVVVLGHPEFYPKFGFVPSKSHGILPPFPVRDEVFMACELTEGSLAGISGQVKYPPAFDAV